MRRTDSGRRCGTGRLAWLAAAGLAATLSAATAAAHPLAASLLRIEEFAPGQAQVTWKTPRAAAPGSRLSPVLPEHCAPTARPQIEQQGTALVHAWPIDCGDAGLAGAVVGAAGLDTAPSEVIVHVGLLDGRTQRAILSAAAPRWTIPEKQTAFAVFVDYLRLGFEHILSGFDHLAFVLALMMLVPVRRLPWVLTAFTLGHSVTLALSTLDVLRVRPEPVEVLIALSIAVVAWEALRVGERRQTGFARLPALMAASFGLLHGLGFAGALREVGLPEGAIPLSLFAFNVGIELGQLAFVAVALLPALLLPADARVERMARFAGAYAIGALAFFWVFERTLS